MATHGALPGQEAPAGVPCFKLVLVGDGGTGESGQAPQIRVWARCGPWATELHPPPVMRGHPLSARDRAERWLRTGLEAARLSHDVYAAAFASSAAASVLLGGEGGPKLLCRSSLLSFATPQPQARPPLSSATSPESSRRSMNVSGLGEHHQMVVMAQAARSSRLLYRKAAVTGCMAS